METKLIQIGNSRGIRIPKPIIAQCGLRHTVELRVQNGSLVISPERKSREGWEEAFRATRSRKDNELLLEPVKASKFDRREWQW